MRALVIALSVALSGCVSAGADPMKRLDESMDRLKHGSKCGYGAGALASAAERIRIASRLSTVVSDPANTFVDMVTMHCTAPGRRDVCGATYRQNRSGYTDQVQSFAILQYEVNGRHNPRSSVLLGASANRYCKPLTKN